ncbi:MAG TPA: AraC family transcriptional regulator [Prosthecobacter sp.]|nr:AraC family transcriptional regulator [Prosthecobacter sp.]
MPALPGSAQKLLATLAHQKQEIFDLADRIDARRYLGRKFPEPLPLLVSLQQYPGYRRMVGENWMHWHDYHEFFVALSGKGDFRAGNDRFQFYPGDVVLVDPLKIHGVMQMDASHTALVVLFPSHLVTPNGASVDEAFLSAWDRRSEGVLPVLRAGHQAAGPVHDALADLAQTWFTSGHGEERWLTLKLQFLTVLHRLRAGFELAGSNGGPASDRALREARLRRALDYVALHAHESLAQPTVARAAGMSTSRFRMFFKETTGWGFSQYLWELRVERAAKLLRGTTESVATIAHRTGFADQSHLLRCFKQKYGSSPLAYRRKHQA